jgi:hypothetical protein
MTEVGNAEHDRGAGPAGDSRDAPLGAVTPEMQKGQWGPILKFPNAAIHTHVLPNGRVLMWGRRDRRTDSLDVHECTPFVWDPTDPTDSADPLKAKTASTPQPALANGTKVNLFCGGHAFLADGHLLVVGGHLFDGVGVDQAALYTDDSDNAAGKWTPSAIMGKGRWYPTATTLPDGGVLVLAGSFKPSPQEGSRPNRDVQIWRNGVWAQLAPLPDDFIPDNYPRTHVLSDGRVYVSGPLKETWLLTISNGGRWDRANAPRLGQCDYAPAVMYDVDKIIFIGGGGEPTARCETIDFSQPSPQWDGARDENMKMHFPRRQHNATLLPDGTVLVTGGTRGAGFNNLDPGRPVHTAELWDPIRRTWTELAAEDVNRCYHATAVLLPDATVLSAGGGEFKIPGDQPNHPRDTHHDAQIFRPPYLFKGDRPEITAAPTAPVTYGDTFDIGTDQPGDIAKVSWIRLPSVTHAFDQSQRINFLQFQAQVGKLVVTAPSTPNVCPPGPYMLFILNKNGVPSVAKILQIQTEVPDAPTPPSDTAVGAEESIYEDPYARQVNELAGAEGTTVLVGITSTCPYGLSACWGGAYEALSSLEGVEMVNPIADADDSTAEVVLDNTGLPPLARWVEQFRDIVNERYEWRGVEVTLAGDVEERDGILQLAGHPHRPAVLLGPLTASAKIQWDNASRSPKTMEEDEAGAYHRLAAAVSGSGKPQPVTVTGTLHQSKLGYRLLVRTFSL